jgi:hypothetical protein
VKFKKEGERVGKELKWKDFEKKLQIGDFSSTDPYKQKVC